MVVKNARVQMHHELAPVKDFRFEQRGVGDEYRC